MNEVFNFDEFSMPMWIQYLYMGLYLVVFLYAIKKTILVVPRDKRQVNAGTWILIYFIVNAMFYCINSDYFSYRDWMKIKMDDQMISNWPREKVYAYIIYFCQSLDISYPYELFRLLVWGLGLVLVFFTAKMYRSIMMPGLVMMFLFSLYRGTYSYGRVSLGMAVFFMGVSILMWGKNGLLKFLGVVLAISSYFFHHQMIICIGLLPAVILPFEKKRTIVFALLLLGMMMAVIYYITSHVSLMESVFGADELAEKMETYNEKDRGAFRVSTAVGYLNIFLPFVFVTFFFYGCKNLPKPIVGIYRVTFLLIMAMISFFVVSGPRSTYTYRVLYMAIIPNSILISYCFNKGYFKNYQLAIVFFLALVTNSLRLFSSTQN